jgi:hypothetical protein
MNFLKILVFTFIAANIAVFFQRIFSWPYWAYYILAAAFGAALYLLNNFLIVYYIRKRSPEFASKESLPETGFQKWELSGGLGIVPRWVSLLGLLGIGFIFAIPFELLALILRTYFR